MFIAAQIIGIVGLVFGVWSFQQNSRRGILTLQIITALVFTLHFILLGAFTGAFLNLSSAIRNMIFSQSHKKWAASKWWMVGFMALFIVVGILTYQNIFSLFPVVSCVMQTFTFWLKNPKIIRILSLPISLCWMVYNIANLSYAGMATEAIAFSSILIAMFRFDFREKQTLV